MNVVEFLRCKGMEKRLEGGIGQVMQRDVENVVDGMKCFNELCQQAKITEHPFQILTKNSSRRKQCDR